jgi:gluconate 5-dehydrogenase
VSLNRFDLSGRKALVTGSSRGIGLALARGLAQAGAQVMLNGRDPVRTEDAAATLRDEGLAVQACVFDVTDPDQVSGGMMRFEQDMGPMDILVNNAGIQRRSPLFQVPEDTWAEVIETNLTAVFRCGREAARLMAPRGRGKIINIASLMSEAARPGVGPYAAAKGGVKMLTRAMCVEWAPLGLNVNAIGPGYFATEMNAALVADEAFDAWIRRRTPAGRWGNVDELIGAAIFLASDASSFVNGQVLYVDGGVLAGL